MFSIKNIGLTALMVSMLVGCVMHDEDLLVGESANASATKIINSPSSAQAGHLLIKLNEKATLAFEKSELKSDITRSGIEPLNRALRSIGATSIERLFTINQKHEIRTREMGLHRWYVVKFDSNEQLTKAAKLLAEIEDVEIVQYNKILSHRPSKAAIVESGPTTRLAVEQVNDPLFNRQWHYYNTGSGIHEKQVAGKDVNVKEAWLHCTGDPSIIVAIIDEGVDYNHEDLKANMWVNKGEIANNGIDDDGNGYVDDVHGYNFCTADGKLTWDKPGDSGHGTHVAGTVAAVNNNGKGVCGVAGGDGSGNGVKIMSAQKYSGTIDSDEMITANTYKYAADNGAVIAQCSWGYNTDPNGQASIINDKEFKRVGGVLYDAILYFQSAKNSDVIDGGLVIFASGNDNLSQSGYPAGYRDFVSVAATGCDGMPTFYTNHGPGVNVCAPGGNMEIHGSRGGVLSALPNNKYGYMDGTSMACPHVSGVAALGLSHAKKLGKKFSLEEFTSMLILSTDDINSHMATDESIAFKYTNKMGTGSINALRMIMNVEGVPCVNIPKGQLAMIDLKEYLIDQGRDITIIDNDKDSSLIISNEDKEKLGVTNGPRIFNGKLIITCEKAGHALINVSCVLGDKEAGSDDKMGGRASVKQLAIIVRDGHTANGGWM